MRESNFRTHVTQSMLTLPIVAAWTTVLWLLPDIGNAERWLALITTALTAYLLVELNNHNALIRIRSRMVSVSFLLLTAACPFLHHDFRCFLPALCYTAALHPLFSAYQSPEATGRVYYAFLLLSLGSLAFPPLLVVAPLCLLSLFIQLRALSLRTFLAALLGIATPYYLGAALGLATGQLDAWTVQLATHLIPRTPTYAVWLPARAAVIGFLALLTVLAIAHLLRTAYNDKIRTRMLHYVLALQVVALLLCLLLQPQWCDRLLPVCIASSAPLIAHHLTLARGRRANLWFKLGILAFAVLTLFNYYCLCLKAS